MRILFIVHQFFPEFQSGTERVALNLARSMQRAGHYIHVLTCAVNSAHIAADDVSLGKGKPFSAVYGALPVTFLPRSVMPVTADISLDSNPDLVEHLVAWLQKQQFDVAHVMHTMRMGGAVLAVQRCALPYVVTLTDFFLPCARINLVNLRGHQCAGPDEGRRCTHDCLVAPWTSAAYSSRFAQGRALLQGASDRIAPSTYVASRYRDMFAELRFRVIHTASTC